jgi:hypothetical protein
MQLALRPDRCHVVFAMDEYLDGPFDAAKPRLYAIIDPDWPNAWQEGLPRDALITMIARGGEVVVMVGSWWRYYHDGTFEDGRGEFALGKALGMFRAGELPPGISPTFDADEFMRRRA